MATSVQAFQVTPVVPVVPVVEGVAVVGVLPPQLWVILGVPEVSVDVVKCGCTPGKNQCIIYQGELWAISTLRHSDLATQSAKAA